MAKVTSAAPIQQKKTNVRPGKPRMPSNILWKLFGFTILLFMVPLGGFYLSKNYIFRKNGEIYSALVAVVGANLILLAYIVSAFSDFDGDDESAGVIEQKKQN